MIYNINKDYNLIFKIIRVNLYNDTIENVECQINLILFLITFITLMNVYD
jgi:hypothetical protein